MTGGRIKRIQKYTENEAFLLTYGDGVSDVNIPELVKSHKRSGKLASLTAVQPSGKFGAIDIDSNGSILSFKEKPKGDGAWINGGFFVCQPGIFDYIRDGDETIWERGPLEPWPTTANSAPSNMRGSGSHSIRCATRTSSKNSGEARKRHGSYGFDRSKILAR